MYACFNHFGKGLQEQHRLLLAFLMAVRVQIHAGTISDLEWELFSAWDTVDPQQVLDERPMDLWITDKIWSTLRKLERVCFGITENFLSHPVQWKVRTLVFSTFCFFPFFTTHLSVYVPLELC